MATRTEGVNWTYDDLEAGYGIVPLPGDRIGIPVVAYEFPYKYPRNLTSGERKEKPLGEAGYATWKKDRLCAVVADDRGEFTTHKMVVGGSQLSLNLATYGHGGYVSVEVRDAKGKPVPGYTFAESDPLACAFCASRSDVQRFVESIEPLLSILHHPSLICRIVQ